MLFARVEWTLSLLILAAAGGVGAQLYLSGHLASPLQPDPGDFGMDLFRTAYWGERGGMYSVWRSVYPPLSFLLVRLFSDPGCYVHGPYDAKLCDHGLLAAFGLFYALDVGLAAYVFWRLDRRTAAPRTLALAAGLPMLYGLEWANLVIVCFAFFVVAEGGAVFPVWARRIAGGVALNLKPYLLFAAYPTAALRRTRCLIWLGVCSVGVYLVSLAVMGVGSPADLIADVWYYAHGQPQELVRYNHLLTLAQADGGVWRMVYPLLLRTGQVAVVLCCIAATLSPGAVRPRRLAALLLTGISAEVTIRTHGYAADYSQIFFVFLMFMEAGDSAPSGVAIAAAYMLCFPLDVRVAPVGNAVVYGLDGRRMTMEYGVMLGQYLRPLVLLALQVALIRMNVADMGRLPWADRLPPRVQALLASRGRGASR